ncbi:hypothetical protein J3R30DRAFT_3420198 [Lentinula aciculospora]|uniref:SANT domain-containing protein n=1 Tax=Lentinula aciculospora TaxID=153920 RepID=A0A9W9DYR3_9AGAR|nr:hypothetical protein J3R30DRAFT_3420198 [Lentinula aciculospora]
MGNNYDSRPTPIPASANLPRRPVYDYERARPASPLLEPRRMHHSPAYDTYTSRNPGYRHPDPYRDYQRAPSPGVYDRYRDVSVGITRNKTTTWYHPRDYYDSNQGSSSRDHDRRESNGSTSSRTFEPSDSWKYSNGMRDREHSNSKEYRSSPERSATVEYSSRDFERNKFLDKAPWPPAAPSYNREISYSREHPSPQRPGRVSDTYRSYMNSYNADASRKPRSLPRSPIRHYRSRSRSRSCSHSRSSSHSISRSQSRSPARHSRLAARNFEPEAPIATSIARSYRFQGSSTANNSTSRIPTSPRRGVISVPPHSPNKRKSRSRSSSQSSIASSRETSVKPYAPRLSETDNGKILSTPAVSDTNPSDLSSPKDASKSMSLSQLPTGYSLGSASELLSVILRTSNVAGIKDTNPSTATEKVAILNDAAADVPQKEVAAQIAHPSAPSRPTSKETTLNLLAQPKPSNLDQSAPETLSSALVTPIVTSSLQKVAIIPCDPVVTTPRDPVANPPSRNEAEPRPPNIPDYKIGDIPSISEAPSVRDAVRVTIMRRLLADRQTRKERVEPILISNLALSGIDFEKPVQKTNIHALMTEMTHPQGDRMKTRLKTSNQLQQTLAEKFKERQDDLKTKVQRLTEEYVALHDKWKAHCAMLDRQAKARSDARVADTKITPAMTAAPPMTGRTTRRSAATLGDAVRSDLEMEQIIASIGSNEATDPNQLCLRNVAAIPEMISVVKGKVDCVYDDNNLRVDDPISYYMPQTDDWTQEEKQIFLDKFAIFPKQFGAISRFLPNKTTAQCVDFYYLHKNVDIDFKNIVSKNAPGRRGGKRRTAKRKANALLTDIRKHDAEVSSSASTNARGKGRSRRPAPAPTFEPILPPEPRRPFSRKVIVHLEGTPTTTTPTPEPEARPKRRRVPTSRASLGGSQKELSEEVPVQPEPEPEPEPELESESRPAKKPRRGGRRVKSAAMVSDDINEEMATPPPLINYEVADPAYIARQKVNSDWSEAEKDLFLELLGQCGFEPIKLAAGMVSKTITQCRDYYQANEVPLGFRKIAETALKKTTDEASDSTEKSPAATAGLNMGFPPFPTGAPFTDMATFLSHTPFSRYTTGVSPYGAPAQSPVTMSPLYSGQVYPAPNFGYSAPPGSAAPATTGLTPYPANAAAYAGRPYIPYPFSYQAGYPPVAVTNRPPTTVATPSGPVTFPHPTNPPAARPFYPGYA